MHRPLNHKIIGIGKSVVFLHGFLESITMWEKLLSELDPIQAILIDLPGHGKSILNDIKSPSINHYAEEVYNLLKVLKVENYVVIGHSMGGYAALQLKEIDIHCKHIVLLNSNFWQDSEAKKKDRIRVADIVLKNKSLFLKEAIPNLYNDKVKFKKQIDKLLEEALQMEALSISYASIAMSQRENFKTRIMRNAICYSIIQGEDDQTVPIEIMENNIKDLSLGFHVVENVGHMSHFENPREVGRILNSILASQELV